MLQLIFYGFKDLNSIKCIFKEKSKSMLEYCLNTKDLAATAARDSE